MAHSLVRGQVRASPECAGGLAREPDRHDQPVLAAGPQVPAEQRGHPVHPRPGHVGHQAGRRAERKVHEPGRHLVGVDRLEPEPGRHR